METDPIPKDIQDMMDEGDGEDWDDEVGDHYSARGGHKERSIYHSPNHQEHWKKVDKGIRRLELPEIGVLGLGTGLLVGAGYLIKNNNNSLSLA